MGGWSFRPTTLRPRLFALFFCPTIFGPISKKRILVKGILTLTLNPIGQKDADEMSLDELSSDEKSIHDNNEGISYTVFEHLHF